MQIAAFGVGLLLLVFGRKLVWLGVAGLGFLFGVACADAFSVEHGSGVVLLTGLAAGLLGALPAVLAAIAIGVGGPRGPGAGSMGPAPTPLSVVALTPVGVGESTGAHKSLACSREAGRLFSEVGGEQTVTRPDALRA